MKKISDLENEKEKVVLKETKVLYRENREGEAEVLAVAATAAKLEEEEIEDEVTAPAQTSAAIPTEGRTKRFLQSSKVTRSSGMSLNADPYAPWGIVDCVFCNFPWGENIFEYFNETEDILTALGKQLNSGCECAFVTKEMLPENVLRERGFSLRDVIPIRDEKKKDRAVPYSKKNKNSNSNSNSAFENQIAGHTGDCFISFAVVV